MKNNISLAVELPVSLLHLSKFTDYHFVIASYCLESNDYEQYYSREARLKRKEEKFIILDNGAFETGESISKKEYSKIIDVINPYMVVLPDKVNDAEATINMSREYLKENTDNVLSYMGVLQGTSVTDYMYCLISYLQLSQKHHIRCIGIPYHWFYRPTLLRKSNILNICKANDLQIHILGLPNPYELVDLVKIPEVTSVDTSLPVSAGSVGNLLVMNQWPQGGRVSISYKEDNSILSDTIIKNISFLKQLCER